MTLKVAKNLLTFFVYVKHIVGAADNMLSKSDGVSVFTELKVS